MSITAQKLVLSLLAYIDVFKLAEAKADQLQAAVDACNGALEELEEICGPEMVRVRVGGIVQSPAVVTIAVTNGSDAYTVTGWASWMAGCSVRIAGDALENELGTAA